MLAAGSLDGRPLVRAQGERLPFADESFDHVTFTYLLRYVDDPAATMCELARVLRPGGRVATLEFGVPANPIWRFLWRLYTRIGLPLAGHLLSTSWGTVGDFLGPSIEHFYAVHPQAKLECYWRAAGLEAITVRRMSLGGGTVMSATKPARSERRPPCQQRSQSPRHRARRVRSMPSSPAVGATTGHWCTRRTRPGTSRMSCSGQRWRLRLIHASCSARYWPSVWPSESAPTRSTNCGDDHSARAFRRQCSRHSEPRA